MDNVGVIQSVYEAFGRGDLAAVMSHVADEVDWGVNAHPEGLGYAEVPYYGIVKTKREVESHYFGQAVRDYEFHSFKPLAFLSEGDRVMVPLELEVTVRRTGRRIALAEIHSFVLENGKITGYRGFFDTALVAAAFKK
jgi:hypothetical protein